MRECIDENEEVLEQRAIDAGKDAVKELKKESRKRTGQYAKGWKSSVDSGEAGVEVTVHNKQYQLTHLLENDHAIKNQTGKTYGTAHGDKIISSVAERIGEQFANGGGDAK
jgi:hypothetical protein